MSNIDDTEYHCNKTAVRKVISGVVGAASSVTSIQVANLLRLFRIPQVTSAHNSPMLAHGTVQEDMLKSLVKLLLHIVFPTSAKYHELWTFKPAHFYIVAPRQVKVNLTSGTITSH